jgi:hypothetical protein
MVLYHINFPLMTVVITQATWFNAIEPNVSSRDSTQNKKKKKHIIFGFVICQINFIMNMYVICFLGGTIQISVFYLHHFNFLFL